MTIILNSSFLCLVPKTQKTQRILLYLTLGLILYILLSKDINIGMIMISTGRHQVPSQHGVIHMPECLREMGAPAPKSIKNIFPMWALWTHRWLRSPSYQMINILQCTSAFFIIIQHLIMISFLQRTQHLKLHQYQFWGALQRVNWGKRCSACRKRFCPDWTQPSENPSWWHYCYVDDGDS